MRHHKNVPPKIGAKAYVRGKDRKPASSDEQMTARVEHAMELVGKCYAPPNIRNALQKKFRISLNTCAIVLDRAYTMLAEEFSAMQPRFRMLQAYRLQRHIEKAVAQDKLDTAIRGEQELAKILGTRAPKQIDINPDVATRDAILKVLSGFTADDLDKMADEQLELEQQRGYTNGHAKETQHA